MLRYSRAIEDIKELSHQMSRGTTINRTELKRLRTTAESANKMANEMNKALHSFGTLYRNVELSSHDMEERGRKHQRLMRDSATLQQKFDSELKRALQAEKDFSAKQRNRSQEDNLLDLDDGDVEEQRKLVQCVAQEDLENEISFCEAMLEERSRGIENLQREMLEVSQMFQDLHSIIMESRADVDTIEGHMSRTLHQANKGLSHIRKGDEYQSSSRRTLLCSTLCLLVCLGILLVYFAVIDSGGSA